MDAKSDMRGERMRKNVQRKALGSKLGVLGCILDGLGSARGVPRASQERPKMAPRAEDS